LASVCSREIDVNHYKYLGIINSEYFEDMLENPDDP